VAVKLDEARPRVKPGVAVGDGEERRRVACGDEIYRRDEWRVEQAAPAVAAMAASARGLRMGYPRCSASGRTSSSVSAMVVVALMEKSSH